MRAHDNLYKYIYMDKMNDTLHEMPLHPAQLQW